MFGLLRCILFWPNKWRARRNGLFSWFYWNARIWILNGNVRINESNQWTNDGCLPGTKLDSWSEVVFQSAGFIGASYDPVPADTVHWCILPQIAATFLNNIHLRIMKCGAKYNAYHLTHFMANLWFFPKKKQKTKVFSSHDKSYMMQSKKPAYYTAHFWVTWKLNCSIFAEVEMLMNDAYLHPWSHYPCLSMWPLRTSAVSS